MLRGVEVSLFFAYARHRERIRLQRAAGHPPPWTHDPVLRAYRFCNVDREDDAVTAWFREHVRGPMRDERGVLLATLLFRWFNTTRVGELLFTPDASGFSPFEVFRDGYWRYDDLASFIKERLPQGPYVTGAYMIKTPPGLDKVDGVMDSLGWWTAPEPDVIGAPERWLHLEDDLRARQHTLQEVTELLTRGPYLGDFMAYEVVTDLRHTHLLSAAPDIMTWANPGPGAARGLDRLAREPLGTRNRNSPADRAQMQTEMQVLLELSREQGHWPSNEYRHWPDRDRVRPFKAWEMRTVEHTLCEFDKYERARLGEGRPKQLFRSAS